MNRFDNPFHDLWVTEILDPTQFVGMFSPVVAQQAEELFGTGNVIIKGRQGSGKSMLLSLLNTHTRVAYARHGETYPAPGKYKTFITAGIHLIRDNTRIIASRLSELPAQRQKDWAATTFADYVNYLLVQDLFSNIEYLHEEQLKDGVLRSDLPINWSNKTKSELTKIITSSPAWYGYLDDCKDYPAVKAKVSERLRSYREYFNFNVDKLNPEVEGTKTDIGEPIAVLADTLRQCDVIPKEALVFLRVDQHEELYELEKTSAMGTVFRQVINRALAMRDGRVAYRVGTRHYAWNSDVRAWGSGAKLENMRDFSIIDIDDMLRRHENPSLGVSFEKFAEDVFRRRLSTYGIKLNQHRGKNILQTVFGKTLSPEERAKLYVKGKPFLLNIPTSWSAEWKMKLSALWDEDPLQGKLCEAWLRQRSQQKNKIHTSSTPEDYNGWQKPYWKKERNEAALVQIAGDAREMLIWSGSRHLVDLAGWNILAFMTICRAVWAAWLRSTPDEELEQTKLPTIGLNQQVIGINEASRIWAEKLREGTASDQRYTFVTALGAWFSKAIREDRALSYPGHTGFSLTKTTFESDHSLVDLIKLCQDQGDLIGTEHTTKSKDGIPRLKWYLNPLLCPSFRIPHIRTKEPFYVTLMQLIDTVKGKHHAQPNDDDEPVQDELF